MGRSRITEGRSVSRVGCAGHVKMTGNDKRTDNTLIEFHQFTN